MAESVLSEDPSALTATHGVYADGTHAATTMNPGMVDTSSLDADEDMLPAEDGAMGLVGPVTGAQHMPNAAQPGH
jgi:hypothetical protein